MHIWLAKLLKSLLRDLSVEGDRYQLSCLAQFAEQVHYETEHEDLGFPHDHLILDELKLLIIVRRRSILLWDLLLLLNLLVRSVFTFDEA